jgi:chorismate-pyruvate lyase
MSDTNSTNFTYPLSDFYSRAKLPLPRIETIPANAVPEPFRALLVHNNDMTPTLEDFHKYPTHLEILNREQRGGFYFREVVLRLNHDEKPVEFGANKVFLTLFPEEAQELILLEQVPLGRILKDCGVRHKTEARHFLRVEPDELITGAFELEQPVTLYGRKAVISNLQGKPLSEIVEILPPAAAS